MAGWNWREAVRTNRGFLVFLLGFGLVRTAVADYNPVPTASMHPNILEGDVVLVNRLAYSLKLPLTDVELLRTGEPARGDVVTFSSPHDGTRLIKRVVGLPGDEVSMRDKRVFINGTPLEYSEQGMALEALGQELEPAALLREGEATRHWQIEWAAKRANAADFSPVHIPSGQYLMLGDNRDNSADSRYIGLVPRERLIGRAEAILASAAILQNWAPRLERFGKRL